MKKVYVLVLLIFLSNSTYAQDFKVLKSYTSNNLVKIALPLGGIGTGTVSLGGRGELRDWQIMNRPAIGYNTLTTGNSAPFFAIYVKEESKKPITKALMGPLHPSEFDHYEGRAVNHHGMPRFSDASFEAAYPFGRVNLSDKALPIKVKLTGYNPFIPGDEANSSIPIAVLNYEVTNTSSQPITVSVCGTMRNFIGMDGKNFTRDWKGDYLYKGVKENINEYKQSDKFNGIYMWSKGVDKQDPAWGTMALTTKNEGGISHRLSSIKDNWDNAILNFWDDFSADGILNTKTPITDDNPMASLAVNKTIAPNSTETFSFYLTWHFPNRTDWNGSRDFFYSGKVVGNYYTNQYKDAWDVMEKEITKLPELTQKTLDFVKALVASDYPEEVKEAALFNLSTLRSQTVFRIPSGHLMGWEGIMDENGSCFGSCTHVWNYENATGFLFGNLAKTMREAELDFGSKPNGKMMNRVFIPLEENLERDHLAAADGQMGSIMRFYREWLLSGDKEWLTKYWPKVKQSLSYSWQEKGWDANADGIQEGKQHNTMDVDYFGPNPQMQFWYFGALKACANMAREMNDVAFAKKCEQILANGSQWIDANLFNGKYYEHKITKPKTFEFLNMETDAIPPYQLGSGCLVDQLAGQYMAHTLGLGYLSDKNKIQITLKTIMDNNYLESFENVFNNMRSFVMQNEAGMIMASWPKGRLEVPFPYFSESMTGFEYTAAVGMLFENQTENGLKIIKSIRNRFDGEKRNPFDEPECGRHYARAMASWTAIIALSGFEYSGAQKHLKFNFNLGKYFWSNGYAYGTVNISENKADLQVLSGILPLKTFELKGKTKKTFKTKTVKSGETMSISF